MRIQRELKTTLATLRRRAEKARDPGKNGRLVTCGASRSLHIIADDLVKGGTSMRLSEEPIEVAKDMLAVISELWTLRRAKIPRSKARKSLRARSAKA